MSELPEIELKWGPQYSKNIGVLIKMKLLADAYTQTLKNRDFLILSLIVFLYQAATAFILLVLVLSVYAQTGSNFSVSGVIVSFATPGFFLMAVAGFVADIVDRRKLIIGANIILVLVVFLLLESVSKVHTSILLSFVYFSATSLLLPTTSAAVAQVAARRQIVSANSVYVFTLTGGQLFGFFASSFLIFFLGSIWTIVVSGILTLTVIWLAFLLPPLLPQRNSSETVLKRIISILEAFIYVLRRKIIWFFFLVFAFFQGLIAFGITLAPGFFNDIVGLSVEKSLVVLFPLVAIGVILGVMFVQNPKIRESYFVALSLLVIGLTSAALGFLIKFHLLSGRFLLLPIFVFLPALGFGVIISQIASRAVLSRIVPNSVQGTVFGALVVLAAFSAGVMSPLAAGLEALLGYVNILILGGAVFAFCSVLLVQAGRRWKF